MTEGRPLVVHLITRFARGGSERRLLDMVRATPHLDHHVIAGSVADPRVARDQLRPAGLQVEQRLRRRPAPTADPRATAALRGHLRALGADLVVTHQSKAGVLGRLAARGLGVPAVHSLSMASFGPGYPRPVRAAYRRIEARMAIGTDAYVAVGHDLAASYRALGVPADRIHVVRSAAPLPGPPEDRRLARDRLLDRAGLPAGRPVIAYVGSLDARKNPLQLVEVLARVRGRRTGPDAVLVIAGAGPLADGVERAADERGLGDAVRLLGHVDDPGPVFQGADVVLLLSRAEGLPQVLVQAASAGTPFVAYEVSGTGELLAAGAAGVVGAWGDLDAVVDGVHSVLDGDVRAADVVDLREWDPEVVRGRHAAVLEDVLAGGRERVRSAG